jgi:hypothetical protein
MTQVFFKLTSVTFNVTSVILRMTPVRSRMTQVIFKLTAIMLNVTLVILNQVTFPHVARRYFPSTAARRLEVACWKELLLRCGDSCRHRHSIEQALEIIP